jgi:hypothetical protein
MARLKPCPFRWRWNAVGEISCMWVDFGVGSGFERLRSAGFWSLDARPDEYADVRPDAEQADEDGYADACDGD